MEITKKTIKKAQLETVVQLETKEFFNTEKPAQRGLLIANIPYGLRMTGKYVSMEFLRTIGDHLKITLRGGAVGFSIPLHRL